MDYVDKRFKVSFEVVVPPGYFTGPDELGEYIEYRLNLKSRDSHGLS